MNWLRRQRPFHLYLALIIAFVLVRFLFIAITTAGEYRLVAVRPIAAANRISCVACGGWRDRAIAVVEAA